ncbi:MAG: hypothetical protein ABI175_13645, partial [Polyangiales bacterium]
MLQKLRYHFDNYMSWRASARFILVFALGISALFIGVGLLRLFAPESDASSDLLESLWWAWGRVADPGSGASDVGRGVRVAEVVTTLSGVFLFALLIGFVSTSVQDRLATLRKGRSLVVEKDHVVILGFGEKAMKIIEQLAEANRGHRDACVVVLSTQEKEVVIDTILERFGAPRLKTTRIVVRNGSPWSAVDLVNVGICEARSVILLTEDGGGTSGDVRVVKSLLAMMRNVGKPLKGHVVVELQDSAHRDVVETVGGDKIQIVVAETFLARLMVQTARQSGLAQVYGELLSFVGEEFYLVPLPDALVGKTFGDAWKLLGTTVVSGVQPSVRAAADPYRVLLAPPDSRVLLQGDQLLVFLADDEQAPRPAPLTFDDTLPARSHEVTVRKPERFLLIGFAEDLGDMLEEIDLYVAKGSEAVVMTAMSPSACEQRLGPSLRRLRQLTVRFEQGDSTSQHDLELVCSEGFDAEILIADESKAHAPDDADARTLMALLLLRKIAQRDGKVSTRRVISEIRNPRTKELLTVADVGDFVVSDELVSNFVAQVAERREIADVWYDLCHSTGHEIYLKPSFRYMAPGEDITFADVTARARRRGEVALGWMRAADENDPHTHGISI